MFNRRVAALTAVAAIALVACSPAASTAPSASTGGGTETTAPATAPASVAADQCIVGVSWNNFQQPRWAAKDRPSMQRTVTDGGGLFIDFDANLSNTQQLTDVQTLINAGCEGHRPAGAGRQGRRRGASSWRRTRASRSSPMTGSSRIPSVLYMSFNNTDVGKAEATAMLAKVRGHTTGRQLRPDQGRPGRRECQDLPARRLGRRRPEGRGRLPARSRSSATRRTARSPRPGIPPRPPTTWRRSSTRPTRPTRRSTPSWPRTTARRSASPPP